MSTIVAASASSFEGAALRVMGSVLNLDPQFINHFMQQHKELTSAMPIIDGGIAAQRFSVAAADHSAAFSPSAGGQNSGRGNSIA